MLFLEILIQSTSSEPIYQQIVRQIRTQIIRGVLLPGDALPSMRILAKELRISMITTKKAYEELERQGLLYSFTGRGSFVAEKPKFPTADQALKEVEGVLSQTIEFCISQGLSKEDIFSIIDNMWSEISGT